MICSLTHSLPFLSRACAPLHRRLSASIVEIAKQNLPNTTNQSNNADTSDPLPDDHAVTLPEGFSRDFPSIPEDDSPDFADWAENLLKVAKEIEQINAHNQRERAAQEQATQEKSSNVNVSK